MFAGGPQQHADAAAGFRRQLQAPILHGLQAIQPTDHHGRGRTAQRLLPGPQCVLSTLRADHDCCVGIKAKPSDCRRVQ